VQSNGRGKKVEIVKFRRRKHHRKQMGHRQSYTEVEITGISLGGSGKPAAKVEAEKSAAPASDQATDTKALLANVEPVKPETLDAPNGEKDDLTKLTGLGPKFEEQANELGIFHYSQIAGFSLENFRWLDDNTRGRIDPVLWVEEAKALMK